jgi:hypothetical protein
MPKVLCDLRIDEISCVDRGAVTRVVLVSSQSDMADQLVEVCKGINVGDVTPPTEHELCGGNSEAGECQTFVR